MSIEVFELDQIYEEYKQEYEKKTCESFFLEHKNEPWFREKYDILVSQRWQEERQLNAKVSHRMFVESVRNGKFEGLFLHDLGDTPEKISEAPYFGFDPNSMTLFLKTIPVNISRWDILNVVKTTPGFVSLSMSEPLRSQGFCRFAWVLYDSEEKCNESLSLLTNKPVNLEFKLTPVLSQSSSKKEVRLQAPQHPDRLLLDFKQSARLVTCLDKEKEINENPLLISEEAFLMKPPIDQEWQLDIQLLYLRRVHAFCFYCLEEYDDERMLSAKCGPIHIRMKYDPQAQMSIQFDEMVENRLNQKHVVVSYDPENDEELKRLIAEFEEREMTVEDAEKARCNL